MTTYYTRKKEYIEGQYHQNTPPANGVCGGGMNTKAYHFMKATGGEIVGQLQDVTGVVLTDPLALTQFDESCTIDRLSEYRSSLATRILWAEEQEIIRWGYDMRRQVCEWSDAVCCSNLYLQNILREYEIEAQVLYTPVDHTFYKPARQKKRKIICVGQASYAKGTDKVMDLYSLLPDDIEKVFIGNASLWGTVMRQADLELEQGLSKVCTHYPALTHQEVAEHMAEAWAIVFLSQYDVGSLAFIEAGLSGCWVFAHDYHLMFDEYQYVDRTGDTPKLMADAIMDALTNFSPSAINTQLRSELIKKHSYANFRKNLIKIVGDILVYNPRKEQTVGN